jgi:hypothetical protein
MNLNPVFQPNGFIKWFWFIFWNVSRENLNSKCFYKNLDPYETNPKYISPWWATVSLIGWVALFSTLNHTVLFFTTNHIVLWPKYGYQSLTSTSLALVQLPRCNRVRLQPQEVDSGSDSKKQRFLSIYVCAQRRLKKAGRKVFHALPQWTDLSSGVRVAGAGPPCVHRRLLDYPHSWPLYSSSICPSQRDSLLYTQFFRTHPSSISSSIHSIHCGTHLSLYLNISMCDLVLKNLLRQI